MRANTLTMSMLTVVMWASSRVFVTLSMPLLRSCDIIFADFSVKNNTFSYKNTRWIVRSSTSRIFPPSRDSHAPWKQPAKCAAEGTKSSLYVWKRNAPHSRSERRVFFLQTRRDCTEISSGLLTSLRDVTLPQSRRYFEERNGTKLRSTRARTRINSGIVSELSFRTRHTR